MSNLLDDGPIYTSTGSLIQIEYAEKCANAGNTVIAIKSNYGIVVAIEKPRISTLINNEKNKKMYKICDGIYMTYSSGIPSDAIYIKDRIKSDVLDQINQIEDKISHNMLKRTISANLNIFTRYMGCRPIGCNFITAMKCRNDYKILLTTCNSQSIFYKACSTGKGSSRAKTELEKLEFDDMSLAEMADNAVRILYRSYDPLKDKEFDIELCYMADDTFNEMKEVDRKILYELVEKYKNLSVDGD